MPAAEPLERYFRKPLQYDWELLARVLPASEGTTVATPALDFTTFRRASTAEARFFTIRPLLVVAAMYPYPGADIKILITTKADVRKDRIAQRDAVWGTDVVRRWTHLELSRAWLEGLNIEYDLCLSGTDDLKQNADRIMGCVNSRYAFMGRGTGAAGVQEED